MRRQEERPEAEVPQERSEAAAAAAAVASSGDFAGPSYLPVEFQQADAAAACQFRLAAAS